MSDGYRNGAFALGLVTGGGIVLNLFLWSAYQANKKRETIPQGTPNHQNDQEVMRSWDWFVATFIDPQDTIAQWGMALLSLAAVLLLWWTLKASRQTLKTTQDIARDARDIGEAQVRAYLSIQDPRISTTDNGFHFQIRNFGATPAYKVLVKTRLNKGRWTRHPFSIVDPKAHRPGVDYDSAKGASALSQSDRFEFITRFRDIHGRHVVRWSEYFLSGVGDTDEDRKMHIRANGDRERIVRSPE